MICIVVLVVVAGCIGMIVHKLCSKKRVKGGAGSGKDAGAGKKGKAIIDLKGGVQLLGNSSKV